MRLRPARAGDAAAMAALASEAFSAYGAFAPPGYTAPSRDAELALLEAAIADPDYFARVAEDAEGLAGMVGFRAAEVAPGLVHFQRLFLAPRAWGTGLATRLHGAAVGEMARAGFAEARLFTPAGQARARRFYEREGWLARGEPFPEPKFGGLLLLEYRLALRAPSRRSEPQRPTD